MNDETQPEFPVPDVLSPSSGDAPTPVPAPVPADGLVSGATAAPEAAGSGEAPEPGAAAGSGTMPAETSAPALPLAEAQTTGSIPGPPAADPAPAPAGWPAPVAPGPLPPSVAPLPEVRAWGGPGAPAQGRRSRRALAIAAALVVLAAAGGVGSVLLRHNQRDDSAKPAATPWAAPTPTGTKAFGAKSGGSHYGSLSLLLLPVPDGFGPGPDVDEYGNDVALDDQQAQALAKGDVTGMTKKERIALDATIKALRIEGAGLRTYTRTDAELVVEMDLLQMKNKDAARGAPRYFSEMVKTMGVFRTGPKVPGYPHAVCALPPAEPGDKLDSMTCEDTEGDLMVTMHVDGTRPLDKTSAVKLLSQQLDRIKDPGEAV